MVFDVSAQAIFLLLILKLLGLLASWMAIGIESLDFGLLSTIYVFHLVEKYTENVATFQALEEKNLKKLPQRTQDFEP